MAGALQLNQELQSMYHQNSSWWTALPSQLASKATRDSIEYNNQGVNGLLVEVILANKVGTPTFQLKLQTLDDAGNVLSLYSATALSANGTAIYFIHPHADKTATSKNNFTEEGTAPVPRRFRLELTYTGNGTTDVFDTEVHACFVI